jgi:hypothetical protein
MRAVGSDSQATTTYEESKTSSKDLQRTIDDDDAALAGLVESFIKINKEITGKAPSPSEVERWNEVAEVLITELRIASARTTISNVPAFLAEHLRRRLFKRDKKEMAAATPPAAFDGDQRYTLTPEEINHCSECGGSTWKRVDPSEPGKGVVRCNHERLRQQLEAEKGSDTTP